MDTATPTAIRLRDRVLAGDFELGPDRVLLVDDKATPDAHVAHTEAEATYHTAAYIVGLCRDQGHDDERIRARLRGLPHVSVYADADPLPGRRPPVVTPTEAAALVDAELADWIDAGTADGVEDAAAQWATRRDRSPQEPEADAA
jgi:hypothetical protein